MPQLMPTTHDKIREVFKQKEVIGEFLQTLHDEGYHVVLAGGACRDWHHNQPAKDFDIFDLSADSHLEYENFEEAAASTCRFLRKLPGVTLGDVYETYRDGSGRLIFCIKLTYQGLDVDFIAYNSLPGNPRDQVKEFDTPLSMIWWANSEKALVLEPEFADIVKRNAPVRPLPSLDGDPTKRLNYLQSKYPQYTYINEVLHV